MPPAGLFCWRAGGSPRALRAWFAARDFHRGRDRGLAGFARQRDPSACLRDRADRTGRRARRRLYLRTSPEFACKKLLAAGETRIFDFARVFRNRERGALHHPEFTMLEWYRANEPYETLMDDCAALLAEAASRRRHKAVYVSAARPSIRSPRRSASRWRKPSSAMPASICWRRSKAGRAIARSWPAAAQKAGVAIGADDTWGDIFSRILAERVEPQLGVGRATILYEYPLPLAALARPKPGSDKVAERFELYACGVELANAFGELTDVAEQRAGSRRRWPRSSASMASAIRWTRIFWPRWRRCRRLPASRSASTGW